MAQWLKVPAPKAEGLGLTLRTNITEGETDADKLASDALWRDSHPSPTT